MPQKCQFETYAGEYVKQVYNRCIHTELVPSLLFLSMVIIYSQLKTISLKVKPSKEEIQRTIEQVGNLFNHALLNKFSRKREILEKARRRRRVLPRGTRKLNKLFVLKSFCQSRDSNPGLQLQWKTHASTTALVKIKNLILPILQKVGVFLSHLLQ